MKILTINTATAVGLETEIGTLEAGKVADIVMLDGDPLTDLYDLLNVTLVLKSGKVVVNKI
jgi:imidazolonepropionase-like amidohydrolase